MLARKICVKILSNFFQKKRNSFNPFYLCEIMGGGGRIDELENDRNDPFVTRHATRDRIFIGARSFFFLTSPLPPLAKGRKQRDEPAVKIADSYVQTELRYDVEMCMFSW